ncbi:MAG TPA: GDSL-type esterase/lipase family protein [Terracidiphilus sp.]|nr:GDSL-type esterase/lipase family protein [Terracidiphilus sp.]
MKLCGNWALAASLLSAAAGLHAQVDVHWAIGPFARPTEGNPVIAPRPESTFLDPILKKPAHWEALHTFNPAAIVRNGKIYVLYRAEDNSGAMEVGGHTSRLGLAESRDGIHFTRMKEPVFYPAEDDEKVREWPGGVEDPRIVESPDGMYVLTYTQWNRETYSVGIATSRDLTHWTKYGPAFFTAHGGKYAHLKYKSAGIVTRLDKGRLIAAQINGMYWMYWGEGAIHLATSSDLIHWSPVEEPDGQVAELLRPRPGHFDSSFPETGPPPVITSAGIVVLYNGKNAPIGGDPAMGPSAYATGEALFDAKNPAHFLTQTDRPVLWPELPYEKTGQYAAGTTFAEGLVFFHDQWFLYYGCADSLVAVVTAPKAPAETADATMTQAVPVARAAETQGTSRSPAPAPHDSGSFYLHDGDTVVFYGDSITEQNFYNEWVELYTVTRFPWMRVRFFDAGVGGDRVSGGGGGPIDQRLERDVYSEIPTVVTVMLGMNDGEYGPTTDQIQSAYVNGYEHILDSIHQHLPGARITLLGPSPYDDVTAPPKFPGGYNVVMQHFADLDLGLAKKYSATFINLNSPVVSALEKAQLLDPRLAKLLLPDRVHPDPLAHWVMAEALLKGWNAPELVSAVTMDSAKGAATDTRNASIDQVVRTQDGLRWTEFENALPLPLTRSNAVTDELMSLTDIGQALNQEPLRVTGLAPGSYTLSIDGDVIGTFSAADLNAGINLADYPTPMLHQAQRVSWLVRDRAEADYVHLRMRILNAENPDAVQLFEDSLVDSIRKTAAPVSHVFTLNQAFAQP